MDQTYLYVLDFEGALPSVERTQEIPTSEAVAKTNYTSVSLTKFTSVGRYLGACELRCAHSRLPWEATVSAAGVELTT